MFGNLLKDVEDKVPAPVGDLISSILTAKRDPHNSVVSSEKADADVEVKRFQYLLFPSQNVDSFPTL